MFSPSSSVVSLADSSSIRSDYTVSDSSPSSSGLTTPADDCSKLFDNVKIQGPMASCGNSPARCDDDASTPKPQFLSKGFRQATKFAQNLITLKKRRDKSMSNSPSMPKLDSPSIVKGPFSMNRGIDKAKRVFSLPNQQLRPILKRQPMLSSDACSSPPLRYMEGIIPGQNSPVIDDSASTSGKESESSVEHLAQSPAPLAPHGHSRVKFTMVMAAKVTFFLPWCIAVGATLSLAPQYCELVAFQTGYVASLQGIRRFAHWAECGIQQVSIFFASILLVSYFQMAVGITVAALVLSRFICVWQDFKFDQSIPLGEDDRQSLYRIAMMENYGLDSDTMIYIKSENGETYRSVIVGEDEMVHKRECG